MFLREQQRLSPARDVSLTAGIRVCPLWHPGQRAGVCSLLAGETERTHFNYLEPFRAGRVACGLCRDDFLFPGFTSSPGSPDGLVLAWVSVHHSFSSRLSPHWRDSPPLICPTHCDFSPHCLASSQFHLLEEVCPRAFLISVLDCLWLEEYSMRIQSLEIY